MARHPLPLAEAPPRVDEVRRRLGGRASTEAGAGELVLLDPGLDVSLAGVVLFAQGDEVHVLTSGNAVRKTRRSSVETLRGDPPADLHEAARDAREFGRVREGERIRFVDGAGTEREGTLVEKCRYGGLVLTDDQTISGVGFRKIRSAGEACAR